MSAKLGQSIKEFKQANAEDKPEEKKLEAEKLDTDKK